MGAYEFGGLLACAIIFFLLFLLFKEPAKIIIALFTGAGERGVISSLAMGVYTYRGFATLTGGDNPRLGSTKKRVVIALRGKFFYVLNQDLKPIVKYPIKDVKAVNTTASNATAENVFLFDMMALWLNETLLRIEMRDSTTNEIYNSLFTETGIDPNYINKTRHNYLVQKSKVQTSQPQESKSKL